MPVTLKLEDYGISHEYGFLGHPPLERLPNEYYDAWEDVLQDLPALISSRNVRPVIDSMAILSTTPLASIAEWKRAYFVLALLTHGYIWGEDKPSERLPPPLTCPLVAVAKYWQIPPTATYFATNMMNFKLSSHESSAAVPENLLVLQTFTGTHDEEWFYLIGSAVEARGGPAITLMLETIEAAHQKASDKVADNLKVITEIVNDLIKILARMHERCDPEVFYHRIRPFLSGTRNMASAGLPRGVYYDEGHMGEWREHGGASAAQSPLIQLFDVFLGIQHRAEEEDDDGRKKVGVLEEMRQYMPRPHTRFLEDVAHICNIREFVMQAETAPGLQMTYDAVINALARFRDVHIRIVARYIIGPSRKAQRDSSGKLVTGVATSSTENSDKKTVPDLQGTAGSSLMPFLKQTRDETLEAGILR